MTAVTNRSTLLLLPPLVVGSLLYGALLATSPVMAVGLVGLVAVVVCAFQFPVVHLMLLIVATLIVPFELQNKFGIGGGTGAAGLLASDALLLTGMARGAIVLAQQRLRAAALTGALLTIAFLAWISISFWQGAFVEGHGLSQSGEELRRLLGFGTILVALPIVLDEEARPRLMKGLVAVGLLLGLWGLGQWTLGLGYGEAGDVGVRQGVAQTSGGRGQLQGGLYGYPVAVILAFAALLSGEVRGTLARAAVIGVIALDGICVILTFERTFIAVTVFGCAYAAARAGSRQRVRAILFAPVALMLIVVPLAVLSPDLLTTTRERMLSIGQYGNDQSVRYRMRESDEMLEEIALHPLRGSGLGAGMWWGRPERGVLPSINYFAHNGYLWLWWKIGIFGAVLLCGGLFLAALRPGRARGTPLWAAVVTGAQGSLLALMVAAVTFPSMTARPITATMGMLVACCLTPFARRRDAEAEADAARAREAGDG